MNHEEVGRYWNENAEVWTRLASAGYDVYRDSLNTPAFFDMLPEVRGLVGVDIGCGDGHNTRLLAQRGASVTAIDVSEVFIQYAKRSEGQEPLGIDYRVASAVELPFDDALTYVQGKRRSRKLANKALHTDNGRDGLALFGRCAYVA